MAILGDRKFKKGADLRYIKGEEIHMTLKEFSEDFYNAYQTVDSLCADGYDTPYIIEHGSEYDKIWGIYA